MTRRAISGRPWIAAKSDAAHALLVGAWFQRKVSKSYLALVEGVPGVRRERGRGRGAAAAAAVAAAGAAGEGAAAERGGESRGGSGVSSGNSSDVSDVSGGDRGGGDGGRDSELPSGFLEVDADGRPARSSWRVLETFAGEVAGGGPRPGSDGAGAPSCSLVEVGCLADIARHVTGCHLTQETWVEHACHLTQETWVEHAFYDVASDVREALRGGEAALGKEAPGARAHGPPQRAARGSGLPDIARHHKGYHSLHETRAVSMTWRRCLRVDDVAGNVTKCLKPLRHLATSVLSSPNGAF